MFDEKNVVYRYKYLPYSEGSLKALTESTIKFTCPLEFNDPFDCKPYYNTDKIHNVPSQRPDLFRAAGNRRGLSPAKRIQEKGKFTARLKKRITDGSFAASTISNIGVVSLSKNALNIPMWSHYADFHRGIVLEFRIPIKGNGSDLSRSLERLLPFPVIYHQQRPHIEIGTDKHDDLLNKIALTKSTDWLYEEEERVIDHERGPGIYHYSRDEILSSVVAGMNMKENNYANLQTIIEKISTGNELKPKLYKAQEKNDEYKLTVHGHPRLDE
ncbi:MAG: DUF2971 domain-containing protein [Candidatus Sedimenticola sp. (ex Thyasira tokunagai)]